MPAHRSATRPSVALPARPGTTGTASVGTASVGTASAGVETFPIPTGLPLVARPTPPCLSLPARLTQITRLTAAASRSAGQTGLALAVSAQTEAAMLAADLGDAGLARSMCRRLLAHFCQAAPLGGQRAKLALETVRVLARLALRGGDGAAAHEMLESVHRMSIRPGRCLIDGEWVKLR